MVTSLGNGFTNMMAARFLVERTGHSIVGVVEGDDGLFQIDGPLPTTEEYAELGFNVKLEERASVGESSFCSLIFDEELLENVTDPCETLARFGWSTSEKRNGGARCKMGLLRSKSLSLIYGYPCCPIIRSLGAYGLRVTEGFRSIWKERGRLEYWDAQIVKGLSDWEESLSPDIAARFKMPIDDRNRILVRDNFGVSIPDQLEIERYLDSLTKVQPLSNPAIDRCMRECWGETWDKCVSQVML